MAATVTYQQTFDTADYSGGEAYSTDPVGGVYYTSNVYTYDLVGWITVARGLPKFDTALGSLNFAEIIYDLTLSLVVPDSYDAGGFDFTLYSTLCDGCISSRSFASSSGGTGSGDYGETGSLRMSSPAGIASLTDTSTPLFMGFDGRAQYDNACASTSWLECLAYPQIRGIVSVSLTYDYTPVMAPVPLPASGALVLGGIGALALFRRRRA